MIQGTSAQITKLAGIKYVNHLEKEGLFFTVKIPNQVHDEIIIEAPKDIIEQEAQILKKCMEDAGSIFCEVVKLQAKPLIGTHWRH